MKGLTEEKGVTEFYPTSQCPYYIIETGQNSAYGDQLFATLKTLAEYKGQEKPAIPKPAARCGLPVCPLHSPTPVASMQMVHADHYGAMVHADHYGAMVHADHYGAMVHADHYGAMVHADHYGAMVHAGHYGAMVHADHYGAMVHAGHYGAMVHADH